MKHCSIIITLLTVALISCSRYNRLTVAFTGLSSLDKGAIVSSAGRQIGYVTDFKANETIDTVFVILKIYDKIKIPKDSRFYLDESLIGSSQITVEYSKDNFYWNSKDIIPGIIRPIKGMTSRQIDSVKQRTKASDLKVDTVKHN